METFIRIKALTDKNKFEGGGGGSLIRERESTYYMEDDKSKLLR